MTEKMHPFAPNPPRKALLLHRQMQRVWSDLPGWRGTICSVNHSTIGLRFMATSFLFFAIGGVLAIAVAIALWLVLTRSGRLALAAARIGISSLPQRWGASSVIVVGIAGVVGVLVAMLAMGEGFKATLESTGDDTSAIVLRGGSAAEVMSVMEREALLAAAQAPEIARDADNRPLASAELVVAANLPRRGQADEDGSVQLRGVDPVAWAVRPGMRIVEGRTFESGRRELVVGQGARRQFAGLDPGGEIRLGSDV